MSTSWGDAPFREDFEPQADSLHFDPLRSSITVMPSADSVLENVVDEDENEEEFVYPVDADEPPLEAQELEYDESISYPGVSAAPSATEGLSPISPAPPNIPATPLAHPAPSPAQLEAIYAAASSGDIGQLQRLFHTAEDDQQVGAFALANDATSRTGLTPLHAASSRGHLQIARWLIEDCGAMTDLEDKEGETALHKAALNGHLPIIQYLLGLDFGKADVHSQDADGYTALHNACSKGYLDIVRWLCELGGASESAPGVAGTAFPGVDSKSKGGWTPLMNAASKGHLPVVRYLLSKRFANPFVRNKWGETAFDIAAAVFEIFICEVLQQAEADAWRASGASTHYNPLAVHITVPVILYENQRLDSRLKTIAVNSGRPRFSPYHLGRDGRRAPFELVSWGAEPSSPNSSGGKAWPTIPAWRSTIQLPFLEEAFELPKPITSSEFGPRDGAERSHFWMSDWTLDLTHPRVDVNNGWQYSRLLDDAEEKWSAEIPSPLERVLGGSGLVAAGLQSPTFSNDSMRNRARSKPPMSTNLYWARRRRWVRVMRRRLDIAPLPFLQPDGKLYSLTEDGDLIPYVANDEQSVAGFDASSEGGVELFSTQSALNHQDYVARARYLADGSSSSSNRDGYVDPQNQSDTEIKRSINKLSRAVSELRLGILGDSDSDRKKHAEVLINTYNRELERTRLAAGASGVFTATDGDDSIRYDDNDSDDDSFHYPQTPGSSATTRPASIRPTDLTPALAQATEFRVPTHDAPQSFTTPRPNAPVPHAMHSQWERDEIVTECRSCRKRFTFYFRKHCRRCGLVYCNGCSSHRLSLDASETIHDPSFPEEHQFGISQQRVCNSCFDEVNTDVPGRLRSSNPTGLVGVLVGHQSLAIPGSHSRDSSSQISDLADCPVCGQILSELGPTTEQEQHVRNCLEGGAGPGSQQAGKYIVYKLPPESVLIATECVICLEEFEKCKKNGLVSHAHTHCWGGCVSHPGRTTELPMHIP